MIAFENILLCSVLRRIAELNYRFQYGNVEPHWYTDVTTGNYHLLLVH
jgi:hypothetical protein